MEMLLKDVDTSKFNKFEVLFDNHCFDVTEGNTYTLCKDDAGDWGFYDDIDDFMELFSSRGRMTVRPFATPEFLAEKDPTSNPFKKRFSEMSDLDKGALLLANHEGKHLEVLGYFGGWQARSEQMQGKPFKPALVYRVKPQGLIDAEKALFDASNDHTVAQAKAETVAEEVLKLTSELESLKEQAATHAKTKADAESTIEMYKAA